jgi:hypothetical protein
MDAWERIVPVEKRNYKDYSDTRPISGGEARALIDIIFTNKKL